MADFTSNNVLQHISGLDGQPEHEILETLGHPRTTNLVTASGEAHTLPTAPQYAVYPVDWSKVDTAHFTNEPQVNDLGEAFQVDRPPEYLGIPSPYRSPGLFLEEDYPSCIGFGSDLWALGCTLFEIRTGRKLFSSFDNDDDEYLMAMADMLGIMPEPWWSTTWIARKKFYKDEADSLGRVVNVTQQSNVIQEPIPKDYEVTVHPSIVEDARSVREMLSTGVWYIDMNDAGPKAHRDIPEKEKDLFVDLLVRLLKWRPEDRLSAEEVLRHAWFNM